MCAETAESPAGGDADSPEAFAGALLREVTGWLRVSSGRLQEATARLRTGEPASIDRELAAVEDLDRETQRFGWCLGVLEAGRGHDLLGARRERQGLRWFVEQVVAAFHVELGPPPEVLPMLSARAARGWELPFLAGWALFAGSRHAKRASWVVETSGERALLAFRFPGLPQSQGPRLEAVGTELCRSFGIERGFQVEGERLVLAFPRDWSEESAGGGAGDD